MAAGSPQENNKEYVPDDDLTIPKDWETASDKLESERGVFLFLGATDTGKSTFCKLMIRRWCEAGKSVALVDCDVGQSVLGPPTTVGLKVFPSGVDSQNSVCDLNPPFMRFVGSTSPQGHLLQTLTAAKMMVDRAKTLQADVVLVDTTGMVHGGAAFQLKSHKIELLDPKCIVAFQRDCEVECLIVPQEKRGRNAVRLCVSEAAKVRDLGQRKLYRESKFGEYFIRSSKLGLSLEGVATLGCGINPGRWTSRVEQEARNVLVGLTEASGNTLALGITERLCLKDRRLEVSTPLADSSEVAAVHFGCLKVAKNGSELGYSRGLPILMHGSSSSDFQSH